MTHDQSVVWTLDASDGELLIHTGVDGRAARMGHRLTIVMTALASHGELGRRATRSAELAVEVDSLRRAARRRWRSKVCPGRRRL